MEQTTKKPSQPETAKFNFVSFRITSVQYNINPNFKMDEGQSVNVSTELAVNVDFNQGENLLSMLMGIRLSNSNAPFNFEVQGVGAFKFEKKPSDKTLETLAGINCPAIMYPYMREFIAELTMRGGNTPLHLPPVNFVALAEQKKRQQEETKK
jgi:preprotein translocase subunit SecB